MIRHINCNLKYFFNPCILNKCDFHLTQAPSKKMIPKLEGTEREESLEPILSSGWKMVCVKMSS